MPVERNSAAIDFDALVAFDDLTHAQSSTARTTVPNTRDGTSVNIGVLCTRLDPTTMIRYITHQNYATHFLPHLIRRAVNTPSTPAFQPGDRYFNGSGPRCFRLDVLLASSGGLTITILAVPLSIRLTVALAPPVR